MRDDRGIEWDCLADPPAAIRAAVYALVRRWRFERICKANPGMTSEVSDGPLSAGLGVRTPLVHVDMTPAVAPLLGGRMAEVDSVPEWQPQCRPWLLSAAAGGQWPQNRRAAIRSWEVDKRCQLCLGPPGTLDHRRQCPATLPANGWGLMPPNAAAVFCQLSVTRQRLVQTRALMSLTLPAAPILDVPRFWWLTPKPDATDAGLTWYTDGSVVHAQWEAFTVAACAIVVADANGSLVAAAEVLLPSKICTSPAAETHAIAIVIGLAPMPPCMVTDCLGILHTAEREAEPPPWPRIALLRPHGFALLRRAMETLPAWWPPVASCGCRPTLRAAGTAGAASLMGRP